MKNKQEIKSIGIMVNGLGDISLVTPEKAAERQQKYPGTGFVLDAETITGIEGFIAERVAWATTPAELRSAAIATEFCIPALHTGQVPDDDATRARMKELRIEPDRIPRDILSYDEIRKLPHR